MDWLPIAGAPKDGTRFIGYHNGEINFWHWQDHKDKPDWPKGWRSFITVYPDGDGPTLYIPMPDAPK